MTRLTMLAAVVLLGNTAGSLSAQQPKLSLCAFDLNNKEVAGVKFMVINVTSSDSSPATDRFGKTQILLDKAVKPGASIALKTVGSKYQLFSWDGRVVVPFDSATLVQVWLVEEGTKVSLQNGRFITTVAEKLVQAKINSPTDPKKALATAIQEYHYSLDEVNRVVAFFSSEDPYQRGVMALLTGRYSKAVEEFSLALDSELKKGAPSKRLVDVGLFLGHAEYFLGDYRKAGDAYRIAADVVTDDPHLLNGLAKTLMKIGDLGGAETEFRRVLKIAEREDAPDSEELATTLTNLGYVLLESHKCAEVGEYVLRALEILEKRLLPGEERLATAYRNVGTAKSCTGDYREASKYFQKELTVWEQVLGSTTPAFAEKLNNYAAQMYDGKEYDLAEPAFNRALEIWESKSLDRRHMVSTLRYLGRIRYQRKDLAGAQQLFYLALQKLNAGEADNSLDEIDIYQELYVVYKSQDDKPKMELCYARMVEILKKQPPSPSRNDNLAVATRDLAYLVYNEGSYQRAKPLLEEALRWSETVFSPEHPRSREIRETINSIDKMREADRTKHP